jgi:DNA-binding transcriptional ArsR family regulator
MTTMTALQTTAETQARTASSRGANPDAPAECFPGSLAQPRTDQELHQVLAALGDPVRLTIVRQLAERGEVPCGGFQFDLAKSTLSHHFKVLRESGVVVSRPEGTSLMNALNRDDLEKRFPGLLNGVLQADTHARRSQQ